MRMVYRLHRKKIGELPDKRIKFWHLLQMARTRQTARKSTGGKAPRLHGGSKFPQRPGFKNVQPEEQEEVKIDTEVTYSTSFYAHYFAPSSQEEVKDMFKCGASSFVTPAVNFGPEGQLRTGEKEVSYLQHRRWDLKSLRLTDVSNGWEWHSEVNWMVKVSRSTEGLTWTSWSFSTSPAPWPARKSKFHRVLWPHACTASVKVEIYPS